MSKYLQARFLFLSPLLLTGCALVDRAYEERPRPIVQRPARPTPVPVPTQKIGPPAPLLAQAAAIPSPTRPSPNGYDVLVRAASKPELAPEGNVALQQAATKKNAPALAQVRQAFKLPIVAPLSRGVLGANFTSHAKLRMLMRAIRQDAQVLADGGNVGAAAQRSLDAVQMGVSIQNGGGPMPMLVGVAIEAAARPDLWKWRRQLSAPQAAQVVRRLQGIEATRPSYAAVVTEAKWESLSSLREILKTKPGDVKPRDWSQSFKDPADQARMQATSDRQVEANLVATMDASIARAKLPFSRDLPEVLQPADPLSAMMVSLETSRRRSNSRLSYERNLAESRLLLAAMALQAYAKDKGQIPQALGELAPKYLQSVPRDPFVSNSPLRYKSDNSSFRLYSVGPDGVDDGGAPIEGRGTTLDSRGDITSGLPATEPSAAALNFRTIVPTSEEEGQTWRYTFTAPPSTWQQKGFDDSKWRAGRGGFGMLGAPNTGQIGTSWSTPDIWMRRTFNPGQLSAAQLARIGVRFYHDEDVEIYINGTLVYSEGGWTHSYLRRPLNFEARKAILPNAENVLAVHCRQTGGGQYIDVGLEEAVSRP